MLFSPLVTTISRGSLLASRVTTARFSVAMFSTKMAEVSNDDDMVEQGQAKLRSVLKQYYQANFNRESTDTYFRNIVKQADWNNDGVVEYTELKRLLKRIGHTSAMTDGEIEGCIQAFGGAVDKPVPVNQLLTLLLDPKAGYAASLPNNVDHPLHPLGKDDPRAKTASATF